MAEMIKAIEENVASDFEKEVNKYLLEGYKIKTVSLLNNYQAILIKEELTQEEIANTINNITKKYVAKTGI